MIKRMRLLLAAFIILPAIVNATVIEEKRWVAAKATDGREGYLTANHGDDFL